MEKNRYIVLTDINPSYLPWAEKDDIQSLIRLFLYTNEIDLEGIILCSSCFVKKGGGKRALALVRRILKAYGAVKPNLDRHSDGYPSMERLKKILCLGIPSYGRAPGDGFAGEKYMDNPGVRRIIEAVDDPDPRPVWIGLWGGANTLAQAIWQVGQTRSLLELNAFLSKIRIHSISDQDNSAKWIREQYGNRLFYIVTPSDGTVSGAKDYFRAVWPGISADRNRHGSEDGIRPGGFAGADTDMISAQWLKKYIRSKGPLGRQYPKTVFIMEGDTPAFLGLIPNGLNVPECPDYGGWSGRYRQVVSPEGTPVWVGEADDVLGRDGVMHHSPQASLWRWRSGFQYDFAARMEWTLTDKFIQCSHAPVVRVNVPERIQVRSGDTIVLDAGNSKSPDGMSLEFRWFWYPETDNVLEKTHLTGENTARVSIDFCGTGVFHLVLEVKGARTYPLCRYKRFVFECGQ